MKLFLIHQLLKIKNNNLRLKMYLTSLKIFLCRNDVRIIIICTATGGILQIVSKQYLKSHPEFLMDAPVTKKKI